MTYVLLCCTPSLPIHFAYKFNAAALQNIEAKASFGDVLLHFSKHKWSTAAFLSHSITALRGMLIIRLQVPDYCPPPRAGSREGYSAPCDLSTGRSGVGVWLCSDCCGIGCSHRLNLNALWSLLVVIESRLYKVDLGPCGRPHPAGDPNIEVPLQIVLCHGQGTLRPTLHGTKKGSQTDDCTSKAALHEHEHLGTD